MFVDSFLVSINKENPFNFIYNKLNKMMFKNKYLIGYSIKVRKQNLFLIRIVAKKRSIINKIKKEFK